MDQCSTPTASHPPGAIRGQNVQEDPALAVTFASVALRSMQSQAFMRTHKSMPAAARCKRGCHAPAQNLATAQASHQSRELLAYTLRRKKFPYFVGARRVFVGSKSLHAGFSIFYWASSRAWHHQRHTKNGLARSRRLRGLPGCVPLLNCCMQDTNRG